MNGANDFLSVRAGKPDRLAGLKGPVIIVKAQRDEI